MGEPTLPIFIADATGTELMMYESVDAAVSDLVDWIGVETVAAGELTGSDSAGRLLKLSATAVGRRVRITLAEEEPRLVPVLESLLRTNLSRSYPPQRPADIVCFLVEAATATFRSDPRLREQFLSVWGVVGRDWDDES